MSEKSIADRINLRELEVFVTVCDQGSVSAAGRREGLTQSAVSQILRRLETRMGTLLIDRSARPLRVTPDGNELLRNAREFLTGARRLASQFDDLNADRSLSVRIGLVESLTVPFVPKLISAMGGRFGHFSVTAGTTTAQREAFLERRIDVAITSDAMRDVEGVEAFPIVEEPFILILPKGSWDISTVEAMKEMCAQLPMVRFGAQSAIGSAIEAQLRRMRMPIRDTFELDAPDSVIGMVSRGFGWALITPLSLLRSWSDIDDIQILKFPGPAFTRRLYLTARYMELGGLPEELAEKARSVISSEYVTSVCARANWLASSFKISDRKDA